MSAATIARLKITLDGVRPAVYRRIEVPFAIRLDRLHLTIQAAMGWTNSHLYEIRAGDVGWGVPGPNWDDGPRPKHERHAEFSEWIEDDFDPNAFNPDEAAEAVAELAKRWSRKPGAKRARPA